MGSSSSNRDNSSSGNSSTNFSSNNNIKNNNNNDNDRRNSTGSNQPGPNFRHPDSNLAVRSDGSFQNVDIYPETVHANGKERVVYYGTKQAPYYLNDAGKKIS